jgi:hypothetical protein
MDIIDRVGTIVTITALTGTATTVATVAIGKALARGRSHTSRFYQRQYQSKPARPQLRM